jgi:hypothetical protein
MKVACNALGSNLEVDDLTALIDVDAETPVMQYLREVDIIASVRNGMTADKPGANNTRSDLENNDDDFL